MSGTSGLGPHITFGTYAWPSTTGSTNANSYYVTNITATATGARTVYNVHTDNLGTPRQITTSDSNNSLVWRWDSEPFGSFTPNQDPLSTGTPFTYNLRFPGQYYDAESGLNYNDQRDYNPGTGRYVESDPIGLAGGNNTYAYVYSDPAEWFDENGEQAEHTKNARPSTANKHQVADTRRNMDDGTTGEKGDKKREYNGKGRKKPKQCPRTAGEAAGDAASDGAADAAADAATDLAAEALADWAAYLAALLL